MIIQILIAIIFLWLIVLTGFTYINLKLTDNQSEILYLLRNDINNLRDDGK
jgi:hypothetical protein